MGGRRKEKGERMKAEHKAATVGRAGGRMNLDRNTKCKMQTDN
jgi:hypothetical protein